MGDYRDRIVFHHTSMRTRSARATTAIVASRRVAALTLVVAGLGASCSDDESEPVIGLEPDAVGMCLDFTEAPGATVTELPDVPCSEQHTHEIFAIAEVDAVTYPGLEALGAEAQATCLAGFEDYVGISPFDSELFFSWLVPTLNTWDRDDDRQIVCVIGEGNGAPLVGTVRDIGR